MSLNNELPERTARPYAPLYARKTVCVLAATFGLGGLSIALEVYRAACSRSLHNVLQLGVDCVYVLVLVHAQKVAPTVQDC